MIILNVARREMLHPVELDRFFPIVQEKEVGVIAMKVVGRGRPIRSDFVIRQLLPYALSYPVSKAILGISDIAHLEENTRVGSEFEQLSAEEMFEIEALACE